MDFRSLFARLAGRGAQNPPPPVRPPIDPARLEEIRGRLRRRAIRMEIGGFHPPETSAGSWFGRVNLALPGETWPMSEGRPLHALAQIDLTQLPFRPPRLDDVELIAVFISHDLPHLRPNGEGWCLRAYPDASALVPLAQVDTQSRIRPFPMRPEVVEDDFPMWEDVPAELMEELDEEYYELFPEHGEDFKLGGWPSLVQTEIGWGESGAEYVFQIASTDRGRWSWADGGVGYFGRDPEGGWALTWQCY